MRRQQRNNKGCNAGLIFGIGLLIGTLLPCQVVVVISAVVICILSLLAF
ncbi:MAG: hypothetical protein UHK60_02095 [Acutalibacteraceae bacterium]|nr:hypothetical protein [Acutalibacteraceae bacterium]MEE1281033.1 hypothetical protein [Acutalibacteraceae bacterium]